jgi:predicted Zn finger-like uncharacterized protein
MQLSCPNCSTSYEVTAATLGEAGRPVRCTRCRTIWQAVASPLQLAAEAAAPDADAATDAAIAVFRQELGDLVNPASGVATREPASDRAPADAETPAAPDIETAAAAATVADHPVDLHAMTESKALDHENPGDDALLAPQSPDGDPPGQPAADIEILANQRRRRPVRRPVPAKPKRSRALAVAILLLLAVVGALVGLRTEVVRRAPQMASLYAAVGMPVNLRKLIFTDVRITKETHDGVQVLLVEGTIVSTSATPVDVPRLRFAMRNSTGSEVYTWTALPSQSKLAPFDSLVFHSRLASPPDDGHDIVVRFFNRHDVVANLH